MKKIAAAEKAAPKAVRSVVRATEVMRNLGDEDQRKLTAVERLSSIADGPVMLGSDNRDWNFAVENEAQGTQEIAGQLEMLRGEISVLESVLRSHMPDHLYDDKEDGEAVAYDGYDAASAKSRTPAVSALCEIANTVQRLRRHVSYITTNVVV